MAKSISSPPGAYRFRSISVLILVLVCIVIFLGYSQYLTQKTDLIARDRVLNRVQQALAMMLYDYAVHGKLDELQHLDGENPFTLMGAYRAKPNNYNGVIAEEGAELQPGWYYDLSTRKVVWVGGNGERVHFVLQFEFTDSNQNGRFDAGLDAIQGLGIKRASR